MINKEKKMKSMNDKDQDNNWSWQTDKDQHWTKLILSLSLRFLRSSYIWFKSSEKLFKL